ncbi:uncharacterized protein LOC126605123 isoform X3 [Malus sylvestris]|uniref:uncharacterized protein LOC126605123 isoform X3 n=1 Tax=Malus sylvestris TaxID=3752 RepID=UPI0021AC7C55|nr:uncharacterized protein LOC126605123 isoform X3 [Malus sylvestris]
MWLVFIGFPRICSHEISSLSPCGKKTHFSHSKKTRISGWWSLSQSLYASTTPPPLQSLSRSHLHHYLVASSSLMALDRVDSVDDAIDLEYESGGSKCETKSEGDQEESC